MRVVFWGSPPFAVATLEAVLSSGHELVAVVTRPPRPAGRGRRAQPTPVAEVARTAGLPVLAPGRPRGEEFLATLRELGAEVYLVAAYGAILPAAVLETPPRGALNVHASLLPLYRGAAPVTRALLDGREATGITIMRMEAGLDTGPICLQEETPIAPDETAGTLTARLAAIGGRLAVAALDRLEAGTLPEVPQDDSAATYAPKVEAEEALLDWSRTAAELERRVRAFDPRPGAWTTWRGERLKVFRLEPAEGSCALGAGEGAGRRGLAAPGEIAAAEPEPVVRAGDGWARLAVVQPPGGKRISGAEWARGRAVEAGERLGADP